MALGIISCACIPLLVCLLCDSAAGGTSTHIFHLPDIHTHSSFNRLTTGNASAACNSSKSSDMDPKVSSDEAALSSGADSRRPKSSYAYAVLCWAVSVAFSCTMANSFW